ncbi:MAG: AAA family ATPase [Desulfobacterales bacterium]|jgi:CO dehydrogenase maturation factor|nr:AAA family ATPase [Desulfobacteraceae bacterium]MBT4365102.1 AAA family ATPase [Desulfobacteraceae bacterium]MBT7085601.1 AAA family ATPase [Desulfobacterales bacterium]MBT7697221.1 AAA family ATPase [Desulfobacterales bacterium]
MPFSIALAGKGGTGKTTVSGMLIKYLISKDMKPILAVDADSNPNLNEVLGMKVDDTLGDAREDMKKGKVPDGMTKDIFISMRLEEAIAESDDYDLIVMGQPEGSGCYCAANTLLSGFLEKLTGNYDYVIMDNEAGMEHISRLTTKNFDILLIVTDTSRRGLQAGFRIKKLAEELNIGIGRCVLVVNQVKEELPEEVLKIIEQSGLELGGTIPEDHAFYEYDLNGRPTIEMPEDNNAIKAAYEIFDKIIK